MCCYAGEEGIIAQRVGLIAYRDDIATKTLIGIVLCNVLPMKAEAVSSIIMLGKSSLQKVAMSVISIPQCDTLNCKRVTHAIYVKLIAIMEEELNELPI